MKFLQLKFIPQSSDFGLLVLRVWLGASMLWLHGLVKVQNFGAYAANFQSKLGLNPKIEFGLATGAEVVGAGLLVLGLFTRISALSLVVTMAVAFFMAHKGQLTGDNNGELAFIYLAGYLTIFLAGPGRFSVDAKLGGR